MANAPGSTHMHFCVFLMTLQTECTLHGVFLQRFYFNWGKLGEQAVSPLVVPDHIIPGNKKIK